MWATDRVLTEYKTGLWWVVACLPCVRWDAGRRWVQLLSVTWCRPSTRSRPELAMCRPPNCLFECVLRSFMSNDAADLLPRHGHVSRETCRSEGNDLNARGLPLSRQSEILLDAPGPVGTSECRPGVEPSVELPSPHRGRHVETRDTGDAASVGSAAAGCQRAPPSSYFASRDAVLCAAAVCVTAATAPAVV